MRILYSFLFLITFSISFGQNRVQNLLVNNSINPIGLDSPSPGFSWQLSSGKRAVLQKAYEIKMISGKTKVWNSGKVLSEESVHIPYSGPALESEKKYIWQVRTWDNSGKVSEWSEPAFFQTGFLSKSDWKAKWISPGYEEDSLMRPSPLFRKEFPTSKKIISAIAYITSHGLYEAQINGKRIGDAYLSPGWTSYKKHLPYQVYDITGLLKNGKNALGITLGNGWYRGYLAWGGKHNIYGKDISLLFQMRINYADGSSELIVSDETWKSSTGSLVYSEIYNGESQDARLDKAGWTLPGYEDKNWSGVKLEDFSNDNLVASINEPIRKHEYFKPIRIFKTPKGEQVLDFGQNLVGWVILKVKGKAGDKIILSHAEVLDKQGNFYIDNLRAAKSQDTYILKGGEEETFEPHFTWHGFQFLKVEGYPGELKPENFMAVALYSDMKPTGNFLSSNVLVNHLQHNIQWGQKGNFLDVPTDCPQRDERLGWTGDAQVFSRTAAFNMQVDNFFSKWLQDIAFDQEPNGSIPFVVPNVLGEGAGGSTGWADVSTIIPWNMYLAYGDKSVLERQYASMKAWVGYMTNHSKQDLWNTGFHFGDWLFYRPLDDNDGRAAVTDKYLIAQSFYAHSTQLLLQAARVLGKEEDINAYTALIKRIKDAYLKEYVTPNGRLISSTQTAYVLALNFDMLPENLRAQAAERLVENIKSYDNHLTTGFLGTPYLCHVLSRFGYDDMAYTLLLQETYPSWLYPVKMGATTIWERWDGIKPDSTFEVPSMNSYNHYSYGAIGDWMYRKMVGLDTYEDGVGYKHSKIQPHIGGGFSSASASLETYYGKLSNSWNVENNRIIMDVEIPPNTRSSVFLPTRNRDSILENGKPIGTEKEILISGLENGYTRLELGSGTYHFSFRKEK